MNHKSIQNIKEILKILLFYNLDTNGGSLSRWSLILIPPRIDNFLCLLYKLRIKKILSLFITRAENQLNYK